MFFPDSLVRFVQAEISTLRVARVPGHRALAELVAVDRVPQLCILEERFADADKSELDSVSVASGGAGVALAYYQAETARRFFSDAGRSDACSLGYVPLAAQMEVWLAAMRMQLCGERYVPSELMAGAKAAPVTRTERARPHPAPEMANGDTVTASLTERELQVLELVSDGKQNKSIADELGLSEHTVKLHVHHVLAKLNVRNRTGATTWYVRNRRRLEMSGGLDP